MPDRVIIDNESEFQEAMIDLVNKTGHEKDINHTKYDSISEWTDVEVYAWIGYDDIKDSGFEADDIVAAMEEEPEIYLEDILSYYEIESYDSLDITIESGDIRISIKYQIPYDPNPDIEPERD